MSLIAHHFGAKEVIAIDRRALSNVFQAVLKCFPETKNRIKFIDANIMNFNRDIGKFDIIFSETIGYLGFEENINSILCRARNIWSTPESIIIPRDLKLKLRPILLSGKNRKPYLTNQTIPLAYKIGLTSSKKITLGLQNLEVIKNRFEITSRKLYEFNAVEVYFISFIYNNLSISNFKNKNWPHIVIPLNQKLVVLPEHQLVINLVQRDDGKTDFRIDMEIVLDTKIELMKSFRSSNAQLQMNSNYKVNISTIVNQVNNILSVLRKKYSWK